MNWRGVQIGTKLVLDRLVAVAGVVALSPLLFVVGVLVKLEDGGPVFFRQPRAGLRGAEFMIWKFRTMIIDADTYLDGEGKPISGRRITRIGTWLRRSSFDELPQLLNIIRGEMSFIGPRPSLPDHAQRYSAHQQRRFEMRPGVTGLAQVNGRNSIPWSRRLALDVEYVDNYSLWLDVKILALTTVVWFTGHGLVLDRNPQEADDLPRGERVEGTTHDSSVSGEL